MVTEDATKKAFSANISRILKERGHSAYWLMKELGLKPGFYEIVRGKVCPSVHMAARIANALDVTVDELLYGVLENIAE